MLTSSEKSSPGRRRLVETITSPIGFFALALLIVEAFLATVLIGANLQANEKMLGVWTGVAMFIVVVVMVFMLVWSKPEHFVFDRTALLEREKMRRSAGSHQLNELAPTVEETLQRELPSDRITAMLSTRSGADLVAALKEEATRISENIKQSAFIAVDFRPFARELGIETYPIIAAFKTMGDLTDELYFALKDLVRPYAYGTDWILRDKASGRIFPTLRMLTGTPVGTPLTDTRSLDDVGIRAGKELEVVQPPSEKKGNVS